MYDFFMVNMGGDLILNTPKCISDMYYKYIEEELNYKISDELLGKKYVIDKQFGMGNFIRMKIEEGLEVSRLKADKTEMNFDNRGLSG